MYFSQRVAHNGLLYVPLNKGIKVLEKETHVLKVLVVVRINSKVSAFDCSGE